MKKPFRALGVGTAWRSALLPGMPTIAGVLKGFEAAPGNCISVPAKTPQAEMGALASTEAAKWKKLSPCRVRMSNEHHATAICLWCSAPPWNVLEL